MHRQFFVPVGVFVLATAQVALFVFGAGVLEHPRQATTYAIFVASGVSALLAGFGADVGLITWRTFGGVTYVLLAGTILGPILAGDVPSLAYLPGPAFGVVVVLAIGLLVAMGIDVALDSGRILRVEPSALDGD